MVYNNIQTAILYTVHHFCFFKPCYLQTGSILSSPDSKKYYPTPCSPQYSWKRVWDHNYHGPTEGGFLTK